MIVGIHHTSITTNDHEKMVWFYRDVIGLEEAIHQSWDVGYEAADRVVGLKDTAASSVLFRVANMFLELWHYHTPVGKPNESMRPVNDCGITHICFDVEDIHFEYNRMVELGIEFHCAPEEIDGVGWTTYGRDPDGNIFEIQEIIDKSSIWRLGTLREPAMNRSVAE